MLLGDIPNAECMPVTVVPVRVFLQNLTKFIPYLIPSIYKFKLRISILLDISIEIVFMNGIKKSVKDKWFQTDKFLKCITIFTPTHTMLTIIRCRCRWLRILYKLRYWWRLTLWLHSNSESMPSLRDPECNSIQINCKLTRALLNHVHASCCERIIMYDVIALAALSGETWVLRRHHLCQS